MHGNRYKFHQFSTPRSFRLPTHHWKMNGKCIKARWRMLYYSSSWVQRRFSTYNKLYFPLVWYNVFLFLKNEVFIFYTKNEASMTWKWIVWYDSANVSPQIWCRICLLRGSSALFSFISVFKFWKVLFYHTHLMYHMTTVSPLCFKNEWDTCKVLLNPANGI